MALRLSRREWMQMLGSAGIGGVAAGVLPGNVRADLASREDAPPGTRVDGSNTEPCTITAGQVIEPQKNLTVVHKTDVLVAGAGPAGVCAAIAAARAGARVTLVERYGYFGGLWTGGLVVLVLGHWVTGKKQVCQGIGEEIMRRLERLDRGVVNRRPGVNPTVDAEALKYVMVEMIVDAGIDVFLHSWVVDAIMQGKTIRGVVFQSKSGRQAILADQVVDTTGDGDIFAAAGAEHELRRYHIGLPYRIGNLDRVDRSQHRGARPPRHTGDVTPIAGVNWVNMHGPDGDGLDVRELSRLELNHRRQIWKQVQELRATPGYDDVYLLETAPQIGVRITRALSGVETLTADGVKKSRKFNDCVGVGGAWYGDHREWQIPYGALLPKNVDNLMTAGRSISSEPRMSDLIRVIPNCWVSGHAAGCAAAVAAADGVLARGVSIPKVRQLLLDQKAYLG
jgi:ribulose 1,5-bisphosphate synthetase/thiazole synthase